MSTAAPYSPLAVFAPEGDRHGVPRVFISPQRYVQGDGVLDSLGRYLSLVPSRCAAVLISAGGLRRDGDRILASLRAEGIGAVVATFGGECSLEEIEKATDALRKANPAVDCVIAVGGGKCVDAGKCVAVRLGVPYVICPSLASNDAPCSALSALYTPSGAFAGVEFFPMSPALVVVDTRIVAEASVRYLVAGMGDAMATWYEARTCLESPHGRSMVGARPTLAASAIGEICASTLYAHGEAGAAAVRRSEVDDALERVVEANTLLSGLGFESGGLAVAHGIAQGLTMVPEILRLHLHGEMVAIGLLTQLVLEEKTAEARKVAAFFARVGLPMHLDQISLSAGDTATLEKVLEVALSLWFTGNEPFAVTATNLLAAVHGAHALGQQVARESGDAAWQALHTT
jgi:glycerol dehydrogenase